MATTFFAGHTRHAGSQHGMNHSLWFPSGNLYVICSIPAPGTVIPTEHQQVI